MKKSSTLNFVAKESVVPTRTEKDAEYDLYVGLDVHKASIVVAPSLKPRRAGDRIKTDRRDAVNLASSLRSGDLTYINVPDDDQESMKDLTRERSARQQLNAFVLLHGFHWPSGKQRWTRDHFNWLESLVFPHLWHQTVLQEYIDAVRAATKRVNKMTRQMMATLPQWSLCPVVDSLTALKGINSVAAHDVRVVSPGPAIPMRVEF